jgi:hypothetical protein
VNIVTTGSQITNIRGPLGDTGAFTDHTWWSDVGISGATTTADIDWSPATTQGNTIPYFSQPSAYEMGVRLVMNKRFLD